MNPLILELESSADYIVLFPDVAHVSCTHWERKLWPWILLVDILWTTHVSLVESKAVSNISVPYSSSVE